MLPAQHWASHQPPEAARQRNELPGETSADRLPLDSESKRRVGIGSGYYSSSDASAACSHPRGPYVVQSERDALALSSERC
jgi:hypothetical protein